MKVKGKHVLLIMKWCVYGAEIILYVHCGHSYTNSQIYILLYKLTIAEKQDAM